MDGLTSIKMDIGVLNSLGYIEVIEISIWLGLMYFGKCYIDNYFKDKPTEDKKQLLND